MRQLLSLGLLVAGLLGARQVAAQDKTPPPIKFGQPEPADFEAKNFVADSGAAAVVLCDYGNSRFGSPAGEMRIIHERTVRLKILKKAGYDYATVEVPLYHREGDSEKLTNLRGFTYVRGTDGKIVKTKLDAANIFSEKRTDRVTVQKFTLPAVQEGAVVEYAYTITSSFLADYPDWTFQSDIPTRISEYRTSIPLFYRYKFILHSYLPLDVNEVSTGSTAMILTRRLGDGAGAGMDVGTTGLTVNTEQHRWVLRNGAAIRTEPYITTPRDYVARISCELAGEQWPEQEYRDLTESWPNKNKLLNQHQDFGQVLDNANFLKELVNPLVLRHSDLSARATAVHELVMNSVKYNDTNTMMASGSLKRTWEQHRGNSADVNLLLVAALRQAGLGAQPVLLSTRSHGRVSQEFPEFEQFNYVVALVPLPDNKELLLDATEPMLPAGTLPLRCLNQVGRLVPATGEGRWISLAPSARYVHFQNVKMSVDAQGNMSSEVSEEYGGYANLEARARLAELGEKKYVTELASQHPGWEVPSYTFAARTGTSQPLGLHYTVRQAATTSGEAQELYLSPLQAFGESRNPFRLAERRFPVDFGMQQQEVINLQLTLPPGYVAELPKAAVLALPNQGGRYMLSVSNLAPNTVQLVSRLTLDKAVYSPEEYHALRELYRQMLAKQAEALVIKKAS